MLSPRLALLFLPVAAVVHCNPSPDTTDGGGDAGPVNTCKPAAGPGVKHNASVAADETWTAASGPHIVTFDIKVQKGATLTIEPCAEVRVLGGYTIVVEGNLVAQGIAGSPIRFVADEPSKPWGYIQVFAPGKVSLAYASIDDAGGEPVNAWGALEARGDQLMPAQEILKVEHVTVNRSSNYGVSLRAGGAFTKDSHDLVVQGAKVAPLRILPRLASNIPTGTYTGNALDAIVIETEAYGDVAVEDVTIHDRGVPYRVGADKTFGHLIVMGTAAPVTLTVDPGVTLAFKKDGSAALEMDTSGGSSPSKGVLVAVGTAEKPIVFTSASTAPAAKDWKGLIFGGMPDSRNRLEYVTVAYAGAPSQASSHHCEPNGSYSTDEDASISIYGQPASAFVKNSTMKDSGRIGINLAYTGSYVDFIPTNQFVNIPGCKVSTPRPVMGTCPGTPCP